MSSARQSAGGPAGPSRAATVVPRALTVGLAAFGVYQLALGVLMAVAPHTFFTEIGPFGAQNDHYIRDTATYNLALGAVMLIAASRPRWSVPVLAFATLQFAIHAAYHLIDIDRAHRAGVGAGDFVLLTLMAVLLGGLLRLAMRHAPPDGPPAPDGHAAPGVPPAPGGPPGPRP